MQSKTPGQLTNFPVGTTRELWSLSYPIMLSLLSVGAMILADRVYLAHLSIQAFNAVSEAEMFVTTLEFCLVTLASYAEVLVGKAFGARDFNKVARPVWTMIWTSLGSYLVFLPLIFGGSKILFKTCPNADLALEYFTTLCYFGPLYPLNAALSSFWVGRGRTGFVTCLVAFCSLFNIAVDPLFIFGYGTSIPALGVKGAALVAGFSQLILAVTLLCAFLAKRHRTVFKTQDYHFDGSSFRQAFTCGAPQALSMLAQYAAWALFFRIMNLAGEQHGFACGISQAVYHFFNFAIEGISKGASSVVANLIGAKRFFEVRAVAASGMRLLLIFAISLALILIVAQGSILRAFLPDEKDLQAQFWPVLQASLFWIWLSLVGEALLYLLSSMLVALGDTRFTSAASSMAVWLLGVLPAYLVALQFHCPADLALAATCLYYVFAGAVFIFRLRSRLNEMPNQSQMLEADAASYELLSSA